MIQNIKKQVNFLRYAIRKRKYLRDRDKLLQKYLDMPQPLTQDQVNQFEFEKGILRGIYGNVQR